MSDAPLGLIAGSLSLPFLFAREARQRGQRVVAVGFTGETDPTLAQAVDELVWLRVGQVGALIKVFQQRGVKQCVMLGQIAPKNLFDFRPDWRAMKLLLRLKEKNAQTIFAAIGEELAREGVTLVPAIPWLKSWMPGTGFHVGPKLTAGQREDLAFGYRIAKEVSRLEIGQTVVVKAGTVLAVEGFEGTDACLTRGGQLAGKKGGAVAVKVAKSQHDQRFDLPCLGLKTLEIIRAVGVEVFGFEADQTILIDRPEVERQAIQTQVALVSL